MVHGTTIIAIKNTDGVFIGADSKEEGREPQCKIKQFNNLFLDSQGMLSFFAPVL
jgi:hypothetical protein